MPWRELHTCSYKTDAQHIKRTRRTPFGRSSWHLEGEGCACEAGRTCSSSGDDVPWHLLRRVARTACKITTIRTTRYRFSGGPSCKRTVRTYPQVHPVSTWTARNNNIALSYTVMTMPDDNFMRTHPTTTGLPVILEINSENRVHDRQRTWRKCSK